MVDVKFHIFILIADSAYLNRSINKIMVGFVDGLPNYGRLGRKHNRDNRVKMSGQTEFLDVRKNLKLIECAVRHINDD